MHSQHPEYIAQLLLRYKQNLLTEEERKEVEDLFLNDSELKSVAESIKDSGDLWHDLSLMNRFDIDAAIKKSRLRLASKNRFPQYFRWAAAASILVVVGVLYFFIDSAPNVKSVYVGQKTELSPNVTLHLASGQEVVVDTLSTVSTGSLILKNRTGELRINEGADGVDGNESIGQNVLTVPYKRTYRFVLQDGSQVYLNAGSTLTFPTKFNSAERRVVLSGEGYFKVSSDSERPFIVETSAVEVKALGTAFNVHSYDEDSYIKTTLLEGKVVISNKKNEEQFLQPGQFSVLNKKTGKSSLQEISNESAIAWTQGFFYFKEEPLGDIFRQIARWYDLDIEFEDADLKHISFTVKVQMYDNINDVIRKFEKAGGVRFHLDGRRLQIRKGNPANQKKS